MKTIYLCIMGSTLNTPSPETNTVIIKDYKTIKSILETDSYVNNKVVIVGSGNTSYYAAKLALDFEKQCRINGETFEFTKNSKEKLSYFQTLLLICSQARQEHLFIDSASKLVAEAIKQCPRLYTAKAMKKILSQAAPKLKMKDGISANEYLISEFKGRLRLRKKLNKSRLSVEIDNKNVLELRMDYKDAVGYVLENPGMYALVGYMGLGKTEDFVKPIFNALSKSVRKVLLMTSTVSLTNALCSDHRNYKEALKNGTINDQNGLASCLYSALLSPSFKTFREVADVAIFEEYESCRDAPTADIVDGKGTLAQKVKAQEAHNELLNKPTVIITDAQFSSQSADHILERTGRQIIVIKPLIEPKKIQKKITYHLNRASAINNIRSTFDDKKRGLTFLDCGHTGGNSKFEQTNIEINKGFDIKSKAVDAAFFAEKGNIKHMQNPTEFVDKYQHVLSTSVWRNGISMYSNFDLVSLLCHQTIGPKDVLQWSERDRPNINKSLYVNNANHYLSLNYTSIFEEELKKGILSVDVADTRELLKLKDATKDIINRILYNNEMRSDYANNLLCMFEILGYEITYDYSEATEEDQEAEEEAISEERSDRLAVYAMLDQLKHAYKICQINSKEESNRSLFEKRLAYADDVFTYYNIDNESEDFEDVFDFDCNGLGRKLLNNFSLAIDGFDSDYYTSYSREFILKKLFECLNLDKELTGNFSAQDYKKFHHFVHNKYLDLHGNKEKVVFVLQSLFKGLNVNNPTCLCTGLLKKAFGLNVVYDKRISINKDGVKKKVKYKVKNNSGGRDYVMCISEATSSKLLKFYKMATTYLEKTGYVIKKSFNSVVDKAPEFEMSIMEVNMIVQDFEKEENLAPFTESSKQKEISSDNEEVRNYDFYYSSIEEGIRMLDEAS